MEDRVRDQIEYPDEDSMIRKKFESELSQKGLVSLMPEDAYRDRNYEWSYAGMDTEPMQKVVNQAL